MTPSHPGPMIALVCLALAAAPRLPAAPETARPVTVTRPVLEPLVTTWELTGSITPRRQSRLSSRTSGLIQTLQVEAGDSVAAGDILMDLDPTLASLALDRSVAARAQAELELAEAERLVAEGRALAKVGGFSRSEAETRETNVRVRRALLESLAIQVREQQETVARHRLPAPFAGIVSRKLAEVGEWVQTGTPVVELVETANPWLDLQAPQETYATLHDPATQQPPALLKVTVHLDPFPNTPLPARIVTRVPVKDSVTRTFLVRLELQDPQALAAPGMSARAQFSLPSPNPVLQVPRDAVVRQADGTTKVWLVVPEGASQVARSKTIELGRTLTTRIEVRQGLEGTPLIVLRGNENLREGQPVIPLPAPETEPAPPPAR